MGVIKSANTPAALRPFSLADIERQGRAILSRAQRQAEEILLEAQKEAEAIKRDVVAEAKKAGREQGLAEGIAEGKTSGHEQALAEHRQKLLEVIEALSAAMRSIEAQRHDLETQALQDVIRLSIAIAERVTKRQGVLDGEVALANISAALRLVVTFADVRICVHPTQKAVLMDALPRLQMEWPALRHVDLVEDAELAPGGCRLMTRHGHIDADLDGQLDRIAEELVPKLAGA